MSEGSTPLKAYIYAEDGALLGFIAAHGALPDTMELGGRYFQQQGTSMEQVDERTRIQTVDYWEIQVEPEFDVYYVCIKCGRTTSHIWWKCCPDHISLEDKSVFCQVCVEQLHPGDPEFARE